MERTERDSGRTWGNRCSLEGAKRDRRILHVAVGARHEDHRIFRERGRSCVAWACMRSGVLDTGL
jgi:hypothetical protein